MAKRKGQYMIVEVIILFSVGLVILVGVIMVFSSMNKRISEPLQAQQLEEVANIISARALDLIKLNSSGSYFVLKVPQQVAGTGYTIFGNGPEVIVYTTGGMSVNRSLPVYVRGATSSASRNVLLMYKDNEIKLSGVMYY